MLDLNDFSDAPDFARTKLCSYCRTRKWLPAFPKRTACKHDGRASVCKDCHRDYMRGYIASKRNNTQHAEIQRAWRGRNGDRERAHGAVKRALKAGHLAKPSGCADCHKSTALEAHHEDYSRPLDVIWLCRECHGNRHRDGSRGRKS